MITERANILSRMQKFLLVKISRRGFGVAEVITHTTGPIPRLQVQLLKQEEHLNFDAARDLLENLNMVTPLPSFSDILQYATDEEVINEYYRRGIK